MNITNIRAVKVGPAISVTLLSVMWGSSLLLRELSTSFCLQ